ncbi:MAG TPA: MarR family transcriptional regulator [Bryobacteraceae bacterium]|nr:MarR family transcriptional regulator [Bryobacteraceae bacterium]
MSNGKNAAGPAEDLILQLRHFIARAILNNQRVADQVGLHVTDLQCINILDLLGPLRPGELAELTGLTTGGITVALDRLEKAKYIRREPNPNDRRSVLVRVAPARLRKLDAHYRTIQERLGTLLAGFTEAELAAVLKFFKATNAVRPADYRK